MPFTPLHLGPGLIIKGLAGRHISITSFAVAQIVMDIEPLVGMVRGSEILHGPTHTYSAAIFLAVVATGIALLLCPHVLRRWNKELSFLRASWLATREPLTTTSIIVGAATGTLSHIFLDSIMHDDIQPLSPWSNQNDLHGIISIESLNALCILAGFIGIAMWFLKCWRERDNVTKSAL